MNKQLTGLIVCIFVLGGGIWSQWDSIIPLSHAQTEGESRPIGGEANPAHLHIKIHPVPKTFREGYIDILRASITSSQDIHYPASLSTNAVLTDTTETVEADVDEPEKQPFDVIQYDSQRNMIVVLATQEEHQQIQQFLEQLKTKEEQDVAVLYRVAMVERDIHPKLRDYPYEIKIKGKCWDDGRTRHRYPKWLDDRDEKFPNILFAKAETDREENHTRFWVVGYAKTERDADAIICAVQKADDTDSDTKKIHHDFMQESRENLHCILSDIFPHSQLDAITHSLQKTQVYQIEKEAVLACESAIPGYFRSALGDDYGVEVVCEEGIKKDGRYNVEVHVFKREDKNEPLFKEQQRHLSTTLITQFKQINMLGIRHHDQRYVLLFSMEKGKN